MEGEHLQLQLGHVLRVDVVQELDEVAVAHLLDLVEGGLHARVLVLAARHQDVGDLHLQQVFQQKEAAEGDLVDHAHQPDVQLVEKLLEVYFGPDQVLDLAAGRGPVPGEVQLEEGLEVEFEGLQDVEGQELVEEEADHLGHVGQRVVELEGDHLGAEDQREVGDLAEVDVLEPEEDELEDQLEDGRVGRDRGARAEEYQVPEDVAGQEELGAPPSSQAYSMCSKTSFSISWSRRTLKGLPKHWVTRLKGRSLPSKWLGYLAGHQEAAHGDQVEVPLREPELPDEGGEHEVEELEDARRQLEGEDHLVSLPCTGAPGTCGPRTAGERPWTLVRPTRHARELLGQLRVEAPQEGALVRVAHHGRVLAHLARHLQEELVLVGGEVVRTLHADDYRFPS